MVCKYNSPGCNACSVCEPVDCYVYEEATGQRQQVNETEFVLTGFPSTVTYWTSRRVFQQSGFAEIFYQWTLTTFDQINGTYSFERRPDCRWNVFQFINEFTRREFTVSGSYSIHPFNPLNPATFTTAPRLVPLRLDFLHNEPTELVFADFTEPFDYYMHYILMTLFDQTAGGFQSIRPIAPQQDTCNTSQLVFDSRPYPPLINSSRFYPFPTPHNDPSIVYQYGIGSTAESFA